ncbi:hypothetical protein CVT24_004890 [Panaeolus cyanescens]|uniref:Serine/threonine-protein kinase n=1 Tax=Panaeolus cyanescens TaxID=181874 RepID=A0A409W223_9AGAR|nr:hypothetical protein CVT24_004890 [Panaeolus cyanescens]
MYQAPAFNRAPSAQQAQYGYQPPQQQRRHPLTNATVNQQGQGVNVNHHGVKDLNNQHMGLMNKDPNAYRIPHNANQETPAPKVPPKAPSSPPLPRQNSKTTPPSPPKVITDKSGRLQFSRVGFLGEGGFARVYEVKDGRGARLACKVVTKSSLKTKKAKTKLYAEIKIHRSLEHPNIVGFTDCFEDNDNVYMTLELCTSGSLMDMLRRRRRFSEPESRFFMVQLIGACHYMHTHQVIHRDLKLGNLFLDASMNVKVGDFGLAALIENPGERKKTICGTPNYIAPEVLFDTANGHSFEVDTWSIGVILYTLVVGRPPFQTKDVKAIYKRIRDNEYEFPTDRVISTAVQHLIQQILTPNPSERPTLHEIVDHTFFTMGPVPPFIPLSAHDGTPDFRSIGKRESDTNLRRLRRNAWLDGENGMPGSQSTMGGASQSATGDRGARNVTASIAQQEKEFQKAVQPGSPISALLSSARQPLVMGAAAGANGGNGAGVRESPLLRKLQAVKESPLRRGVTRGLNGIVEETGGAATGAATGSIRRRAPMAPMSEDVDAEEEGERLRLKELEAQKARIVAQMAPVKEDAEGEDDGRERAEEDEMDEVQQEERRMAEEKERERKEREAAMRARMERRERYNAAEAENIAPAAAAAVPLARSNSNTRATGLTRVPSKLADRPPQTTRGLVERDNAPAPSISAAYAPPIHAPTSNVVPSLSTAPQYHPVPPPAAKLSGFDAAAQTLTTAFEYRAAGQVYYSHSEVAVPDERVFIVSWVDYCNKYGMGYALTDGSVGVHFNDSTTLVLSPDKIHFDYITSRRQGSVYVRKNYSLEVYPEDLKNKVYLLKHFQKYIMDRLYGEYDYTFEDVGRDKGMEWVQKYLRMKHVIVFKLSHDVLQFNFYDHSKVILSSGGLMVTHIDKHYKMTRHLLSEVMRKSMGVGGNGGAEDEDEKKWMNKLVDKLKYCKEVLSQIRNMTGEEAEAAR